MKQFLVNKIVALALVAFCPAVFSAVSGPARSALEEFTSGLTGLQLDFIQVVKSQDGRVQDETRGHAWLQSPDKLRWVYVGDFPETIVADGTNVWIHDEILGQVTVKPQSSNVADTPLMVLTDVSQLDMHFMVTELGDIEDMLMLELRSRENDSAFERILMGLDSSGIRTMVMEDAFGQRTEIQFQNIVRNADANPQLFRFTPPRSVDVVGQTIEAAQPEN